MIKKLFIACAAFVWTIALVAQNISVVNSSGSTKLYRTLQAAIEGADPNSVIYLPGGGFPIADSVKITKKLTIIGIGHKSKNDNVDGNTTISGNLYFYCSNSAVIGCYITGNVYIGQPTTVGGAANDVLVKYCNVNKVSIYNNGSLGTVVNQCYIRSSVGAYSSTYSVVAEITNNVIHHTYYLTNSIISNNIITGSSDSYQLSHTYNSIVNNNIFTNTTGAAIIYGSNNSFSGNMGWKALSSDEDYTNMSSYNLEDIFVNYNNGAVSPASNYHFKDEYKQYENQVGVYADGVDFDKQLAPVPYIVAKKIDPQTDTAGKLNIKIRVKASGEE